MNEIITPNKETLDFIKNYNHTPKTENMKLTSIIILTCNNLNFTELCIESIRKFTPSGFYEIIVVDNNSTDGTVEWLKVQKDLKVIYNNENKGIPTGYNQGVEISSGDNILFLDNDTITTPNWLNILQQSLYSSDDIGVVGPLTNNAPNYQQIAVPYKNIEQLIDFSSQNNTSSNPNIWKYRTKLSGYCFLVKKEVLNKVGLFDEIFAPGHFEDTDLSFRILCAGYKLILCKDAFIHHFSSITVLNQIEKFNQSSFDNSKKFIDKWGFSAQYSGSIRFDVLEHINCDSNKELNCLDIGCGVGGTLLELKSRYKKANIYGLEVSQGSSNVAKSFCDVLCGNVETMDLPYEDNFFDYIMLSDVLEHLNSPWDVLRKLQKYLKKDGYILASIPNLMHISVLRDLINGNFTYLDAGILDRTHLRFFTLSEMKKLFTDNGYDIESLRYSAVYVSPEDEKIIDSLCSLSNENLREQYHAYQYLLKAKLKHKDEDTKDLRFRLIRIDNETNIEENLNYVFDFYERNKKQFLKEIVSLVNNNTLNKDEVLNKIATEALNRNLHEIVSLIVLK